MSNRKSFKSIRQKLFQQIGFLLFSIFLVILTIVGIMQYSSFQSSLRETEESIRTDLIEKGNILVFSSVQTLTSLAEENAFTSIMNLVNLTVEHTNDLVYGIYMTPDLRPWAVSSKTDIVKQPEGLEPLNDRTSLWATTIGELTHTTRKENGLVIFEFAAPVFVEEEVAGIIRYGITTEPMKLKLAKATSDAHRSITSTLLLLVAVAVVACLLGLYATRQLAIRISKPIGTLTDATAVISGGNYEDAVKVDSNDEIGVLADQFDKMRYMVRKKIHDLGELNDVGTALAKLNDRDKVLVAVLKAMCAHTKAVYGCVYLTDEKNQLTIARTSYENENDKVNMPSDLKVGDGLLGLSAQNQEIIFISNSDEDEQYKELINSDSAQSILAIPITDVDELLGVLYLSSPVEKTLLSNPDEEFTLSVARSLAITLKKITLLETIEDHNRNLEKKVQERTEALTEKTEDISNMLQNMQQGLFTILPDRTIHPEYSAFLESIFETKEIKGKCYRDLLFEHSEVNEDLIDQNESAVDLMLDEDDLAYQLNKHLFLPELTVNLPSGQKIIALDWNPIFDPSTELMSKLMVAARDVTELKSLEAAAEKQKAELNMVGELLNIDQEKYNGFYSNTSSQIDRCFEIIAESKDGQETAVQELFRIAHTIKGNARSYGLSLITVAVRGIENLYDDLRKDLQLVWPREQMDVDLVELRRVLNMYQDINVNKLKRGEGSSETSVSAQMLDELLSDMDQLNASIVNEQLQKTVDKMRSAFGSVHSESFENILTDKVKELVSMADDLGKVSPKLEVDAQGIRIARAIIPKIEGILNHMMRNALFHGLETAEEREKSGKPAQGKISIIAELEKDNIHISFSDDGRGLNLAKLRGKSAGSGKDSAEEVAKVIFASGVSTADGVNDIAGQGVGLDAVKTDIENLGGSIELNLLSDSKGADKDFCPFTFEINLPAAKVIFDPAGIAKAS